MKQEIIETLDICLILQNYYFLIEFVKQYTTILDYCSVISGFEGQKRVELLNQYRNEDVSYIFLNSISTKLLKQVKQFLSRPFDSLIAVEALIMLILCIFLFSDEHYGHFLNPIGVCDSIVLLKMRSIMDIVQDILNRS